MRIDGKLLRGALVALGALAPALAGAQSFEGVITAKLGAKSDAKMQTVQVKGNRWRLDTEFGGGPMGRGSIISDGEGGVMMLVPARKMYTRPPALQGKASNLSDNTFTATGKKETVIGYECEYFTMKDASSPGDVVQWCVTNALGFLGFTPGQKLSNGAALRKQFPKGFFVLKELDDKGAVNFQVVKVERKSLDASVFAPPPDYTEMKIPGGQPRP